MKLVTSWPVNLLYSSETVSFKFIISYQLSWSLFVFVFLTNIVTVYIVYTRTRWSHTARSGAEGTAWVMKLVADPFNVIFPTFPYLAMWDTVQTKSSDRMYQGRSVYVCLTVCMRKSVGWLMKFVCAQRRCVCACLCACAWMGVHTLTLSWA